MLLPLFGFTSCLESDLEDLKTYTGNDVTSSYVYYRYIDKNKVIAASGQPSVRQMQLTTKQVINTEAATCTITASLPKNFPATEQANISAANLVVALQVSTAAVVEPIDGAPRLGVPADWSTAHKYRVKAADGSTKEWTISVVLNK